MSEWDYIVVGAGSAGCVIADRLSRRPGVRVLVLEAGGANRDPFVRVPLGYGRLFHCPRRNWRFTAEAEPALGGRGLYAPRGRGAGGSSAINAMVWARGVPDDYADWEAAGNPGWGAADAARAFDAVEGEMGITDPSRDHHAVCDRFYAATTDAGIPAGDPSTGYGVGPWRINTRGGLRRSAADAFLQPALRRGRVRLETGAQVTGLVLEGRRVRGVRYRQRGRLREARCTAEAILSAGAVQTPQILQLSGIGPAADLRAQGIDVALDAPQVGANLQDHLGVDYGFRATEPTLNQQLGHRLGQARALLHYALRRRGPLALSVNQAGALVRGPAATQLYFNPLSYSVTRAGRRVLFRPDRWPGFSLGFNPCRPTSRGSVTLRSPDPFDGPRIRFNALATNEDVAAVIAGARLVEALLDAPSLRTLIDAPIGFTPHGADDDAILADYRDRSGSVFHLCGTARMAPAEAGGVVDTDCRVHGIGGLRVVDASIFPNVTSANTNAPVMMAAWLAADRIERQG